MNLKAENKKLHEAIEKKNSQIAVLKSKVEELTDEIHILTPKTKFVVKTIDGQLHDVEAHSKRDGTFYVCANGGAKIVAEFALGTIEYIKVK